MGNIAHPVRVYAIGDIHGHLDKLVQAHALIAADRALTGDGAAPVIHLGDLVDRGPESAAVIEYLMAGPARGGPWITLQGNHDHLFLRWLDDPAWQDPMLRSDLDYLDSRIGGRQTLLSYGPATSDDPRDLWHAAQARVPAAHRAWIAGLPLMHRTPDAVFVHAGIRPRVPLDAQSPADLRWIRTGFLDDRTDHGPLVVHGHTVVRTPEHHGNRVNLDTGAGYGHPLTVAVIEGREVAILSDRGRLPLPPP
jgi:serine/threonine protein phosphatase 1